MGWSASLSPRGSIQEKEFGVLLFCLQQYVAISGTVAGMVDGEIVYAEGVECRPCVVSSNAASSDI